MTRDEIKEIVRMQKNYFASGQTLSINFRVDALKKLKRAIIANEKKIEQALKNDLGKSSFEGYMCEIGLVLSEITYMIKHVRLFAKDKKVKTPIVHFAARSFIKPMPYGITLIISPWNYPFLLALEPLVDSIAAGNTAIIKPSEYSVQTSALIKKIISSIFDEEYVAVVLGDHVQSQYLLDEKFDYIFFTGSNHVGKIVLQKASANLTPVTLELGGKSPCIVHESAKLKIAAKRIVFAKFINCGQTCVAPDYILCDAKIKDDLIFYMREEIKKQFSQSPLQNPDYGKIISQKHFDRLISLIDNEKIAFGGEYDEKSLRIAPTILDNVTWDDDVMQQEIFGPVLPILAYKNVDDVIETVNSKEKPLALYVFAQDKKVISDITNKCFYGGGCVNDALIHLATSHMGFGGVGESGMGAYHGKVGFDTFSHYKSIMDKKTWIDLPMRYQPYKKFYVRLIKLFLR